MKTVTRASTVIVGNCITQDLAKLGWPRHG